MEPSLYFAQELDEAVQVSFLLNIKKEDIKKLKKNDTISLLTMQRIILIGG